MKIYLSFKYILKGTLLILILWPLVSTLGHKETIKATAIIDGDVSNITLIFSRGSFDLEVVRINEYGPSTITTAYGHFIQLHDYSIRLLPLQVGLIDVNSNSKTEPLREHIWLRFGRSIHFNDKRTEVNYFDPRYNKDLIYKIKPKM